MLLYSTDYMVREKPTLDEEMLGGADYIVLKKLDTDGIRIIGSVLGQSIALDYFVSQVILLSLLIYMCDMAMIPMFLVRLHCFSVLSAVCNLKNCTKEA